MNEANIAGMIVSPWFKIDEAARYSNLSQPTVRRAIRMGELEANRVAGTAIRIHRDAIDRWIRLRSARVAVAVRSPARNGKKPGPKRG